MQLYNKAVGPPLIPADSVEVYSQLAKTLACYSNWLWTEIACSLHIFTFLFSVQIEEAHVERCPKSQQLLLGQRQGFQKGLIFNEKYYVLSHVKMIVCVLHFVYTRFNN